MRATLTLIGGDAAMVLAGTLIPLASAPFGFWPVAIVSVGIFFAVSQASSPKRVIWRGWLFGCGLFGFGASWVYFSLNLFGNAVAPLAGLLTAFFDMGLALLFALLAWLHLRVSQRLKLPVFLLLFAPALWVGAEMFRGWFLTGFPWLLVGTSQIESPLSGYAPIVGVYGVSWLVALSAALCLFCLLQLRDFVTRLVQIVGAASVLIAIWVGGWFLQKLDWSFPVGDPVSVRLVQGNIEQSIKFDEKQILDSIKTYQKLSQLEEAADLIIWPETAVADFYFRVKDVMEPFLAEVERRDATVLLGTFEYDAVTGRYYNSFLNATNPSQQYRKRHLVPFGEYMPLRRLLDFLNQFIAIPMSDLFPGTTLQMPIAVGHLKIGVSICYEDAFPEEVIDMLPDANVLVNVSNDSWFGDSLAPHQHLEIARFRALETGRPLLRVANTGISAIISHTGKVERESRQFIAETLDYMVQPRQGITPYVRWGNSFVLVLLIASTIVFAFFVKNERLNSASRANK